MPKKTTFQITRATLGTYDGATLGFLVLDADGLDALSGGMEYVSDVVAFAVTGDPRGTIDVVIDTIDGDTTRTYLIRDPESTVPTVDTTGTEPRAVVFYDTTGGSDAARKLIAGLEVLDPDTGYDGWEVDPADGIAEIVDASDAIDRITGLEGRTVNGEPAVNGNWTVGSGGPSTNVLRLCDPTNTDHSSGAYICNPLGDFTTGYFASATITAVSPGASGEGTYSEKDTETHDGTTGSWDNREWAALCQDGRPWDYFEWTEEGGSSEAHTFYAAPDQPGWIETGWRPAYGVPWRTAVNLIFDNGDGEFEIEFLRAPRKDEAIDVTRDGEAWVYQAHIIPGTTPGVASYGPTSIDTGVNGYSGIGMGTGLLILDGAMRIKDGSEGTLKAAPTPPATAGQDPFTDSEGNEYTPGDTAACVAADNFTTEVLAQSAVAAAALAPSNRSYLLDLSGETPGALDVDLSEIPPWVENLSVLAPSGGPSTLTLVDPPAVYDRRTLTFFTIAMDGSALTFVNGFSGTFGPATTGISGVLIPTPLGYIFVTAGDGAVPSVYQPVDSDLTDLAALSPSNDDIIQRKAGAWTNRTPAQLKTDLAIAAADVSGLPWPTDWLALPVLGPPNASTGTGTNWTPTSSTIAGSGFGGTGTSGTQTWTYDDIPLRAGTWAAQIGYRKTASSGIVDYSLGGVSLGAGVDHYAASNTADNRATFTGITVAANGLYDLVLSASTKHASSGGYAMFHQFIYLYRTGP